MPEHYDVMVLTYFTGPCVQVKEFSERAADAPVSQSSSPDKKHKKKKRKDRGEDNMDSFICDDGNVPVQLEDNDNTSIQPKNKKKKKDKSKEKEESLEVSRTDNESMHLVTDESLNVQTVTDEKKKKKKKKDKHCDESIHNPAVGDMEDNVPNVMPMDSSDNVGADFTEKSKKKKSKKDKHKKKHSE